MPSFGLLKEQILVNLEKKYSDDRQLFQENVKKFVKTLKQSRVLTEMFQLYNELMQSHFDDPSYAKDYITEVVNYLRTLKITDHDRQLLESLERADLKVADCDPYVIALDTLVFGSKKNIKERLEAQQFLTQKLVTEQKAVVDPKLRGVFLDILKKKIQSRLGNLSESELKALTAFAEGDQEALLANYIHLVDDNISAIEEQISQHGGSPDTFAKLRQAKERLAEMRDAQPTLTNLEKLLVLKEGFRS